MRVRFTEGALIEIEEILTYIARFDPVAALRVGNQIDRTLDRAERFPFSAVQSADEPNTLTMLVGRFPYRIYYTVQDDEVLVLSVRHTARQQRS